MKKEIEEESKCTRCKERRNDDASSIEAHAWLLKGGISNDNPALKMCATCIQDCLERARLKKESAGPVSTKEGVSHRAKRSTKTGRKRPAPIEMRDVQKPSEPAPPHTFTYDRVCEVLSISSTTTSTLINMGILKVVRVSSFDRTQITIQSVRRFAGSVLWGGEDYRALPKDILDEIEPHRDSYKGLFLPNGALYQ